MSNNILRVSLMSFNTLWVEALRKEKTNTITTYDRIYRNFGVRHLKSCDDFHYFKILDNKKWIFTKIKHSL